MSDLVGKPEDRFSRNTGSYSWKSEINNPKSIYSTCILVWFETLKVLIDNFNLLLLMSLSLALASKLPINKLS